MSVSEVIHEDPLMFAAADAGEDTLSLCDMPLYEDAVDRSFSSEDASTSYRDELFEFSPLRDLPDETGRPAPSPLGWDSGEIVFCGKLIRSAPLPSSPYDGGRMVRAVKRNRKGVGKRARAMAAYSSPRSDKWYMMAFGMARFPSEMALSEIRRRQGKGNLGSGSGGGGSESGEMVVGGKKGGSAWGMMMKALGCSRRRDGEAVAGGEKRSLGCIPIML